MKIYNGRLLDIKVTKSMDDIIIEQEGDGYNYDKIIIEAESIPALIKALKKLARKK